MSPSRPSSTSSAVLSPSAISATRPACAARRSRGSRRLRSGAAPGRAARRAAPACGCRSDSRRAGPSGPPAVAPGSASGRPGRPGRRHRPGSVGSRLLPRRASPRAPMMQSWPTWPARCGPGAAAGGPEGPARRESDRHPQAGAAGGAARPGAAPDRNRRDPRLRRAAHPGRARGLPRARAQPRTSSRVATATSACASPPRFAGIPSGSTSRQRRPGRGQPQLPPLGDQGGLLLRGPRRLRSGAPPSAGAWRPVSVSAPAGSLLNAQPPAAVVGGNVETSSRVADLVFAALAEFAPVGAEGQGTMNNVTLSGEDWTYYRRSAAVKALAARPTGRRRARGDVEHPQHAHRGLRDRLPVLVRELSVRRGSGGGAATAGRRDRQGAGGDPSRCVSP